MPAPRPSQSADAEAAARQAEFNEKKWVWVPDDKVRCPTSGICVLG